MVFLSAAAAKPCKNVTVETPFSRIIYKSVQFKNGLIIEELQALEVVFDLTKTNKLVD
jgi:hypothetical protein